MGKRDPRVSAYIAASAGFAKPILKHLRELVHTACPATEETIKWSMPFFTHKGILCMMAAFKEHCTFGCWKPSRIAETKLRGKRNPSEAMGQLGRLTSLKDLPPDRDLLDYIREAARMNEQDVTVRKPSKASKKKELSIPDYLLSALHNNRKALSTFEEFSYSHKKEYVEWITEAKRDETRAKRLATTIAWLTEGKRRNWKYLNC